MSWDIDTSVSENDALSRQISDAAVRAQTSTVFASPALAEMAGGLANLYPDADAGALLAVSRAAANGEITQERAAEIVRRTTELTLSDPTNYVDQGGRKPWYRRALGAVGGGVKSASRWTMAGLNFVPQALTNVAARSYGALRDDPNYQGPESGLFEGFLASTDIGAMFSGEDAGDGFFVGEAAKQYQELKVLQYRGGFLDSNGKVLAFTPGRAVADVFFDPGTNAFNLLSGLTDAAYQLSVPAIPGGGLIRAARAGKYGEQAQRVAASMPQLNRYAGLTDGVRPMINREKVGDFLSSRTGQRLKQKLADTNTLTDLMDMLRGDIDPRILKELVAETDVDKIGGILNKYLGVGVVEGDVLGIQSVDQLPGLGVGEMIRSQFRGGNGSRASGSFTRQELRRLGAKALPGRAFAVAWGDPLEGTNSARSLSAMLDMLRLDDWVVGGKTVTREEYLQKVLDLAIDPDGTKLLEVRNLTHAAIEEGLVREKAAGLLAFDEDGLRETVRTLLKRHTNAEDALYGAITSIDDGLSNSGMIEPYSFVKGLFNDEYTDIGAGVIIPNSPVPRTNGADFAAVSTADGTVEFVGPARGTAMLESEEMRRMLILPDMKKMRRATSKVAWMFEKGSIIDRTSIGDPRTLISMLDSVQNKVWRPMVMMTGGYITRNMADSALRSALAPGLDSNIKHPFEWIQLITMKKNRGDLLGFGWDVENAGPTASVMRERMNEAIGLAASEMSPQQRALAGYKRNAWAIAPRPMQKDSGEFDRYVRGIADQITLLMRDRFARLVASGVDYETASKTIDDVLGPDPFDAGPLPSSLKQWLSETEDGKSYATSTQRRHRNARASGRGDERFNYQYVKQDGTLVEEDWIAFTKRVRERIEHETLGLDSLKEVVRGNDFGVPQVRWVDDDGVEHFADAFTKVGEDLGDDMPFTGYSEEFLNEIRRQVSRKIDEGRANELPELVKYRVTEAENDFVTGRKNALDKIVDTYFGEIFAQKEATVNRSPAARQFYYQIVDELVGEMRPEDARYVIERLQFASRQQSRDYVAALKKARKRTRDGRTEYRIPVGRSSMFTPKTERFELSLDGRRTLLAEDDYFARVETNRVEFNAANGDKTKLDQRIADVQKELKEAQKSLSNASDTASRNAARREVKRLEDRLSKTRNELVSVNDRIVAARVKIDEFAAAERVQTGGGTWVDEIEYRKRIKTAVDEARPAGERTSARQAQKELSSLQVRTRRYQEALDDGPSGTTGKYPVPNIEGETQLLTRAELEREMVAMAARREELLPLVSPGQIRETDYKVMLDELTSGKALTNWDGFNVEDAADYVGGKDRLRKILERALAEEDPAKAGKYLSAEQVDFAAKAYAVEQTKKLFYDAAETSNFADIMKIIAPFGTAWWEITRRYGREALQNPNRLKNVGATIQGLRDADVTGDGKGFFSTDPNSGETIFNFPFDQALAPLLTAFGGFVGGQAAAAAVGRKGFSRNLVGGFGASGAWTAAYGALQERFGVKPEVTAPVRSFSMGFSVLPGFGPVVQMAYRNIAEDLPVFEDFAEFIIPYGAEDFTAAGVTATLTPAWVDKIWSALEANPDTNRLYADMYSESLVALSASGEFDMTDPEDLSRLEDEAKNMAQSLLFYQSIGQFTGPVRPTLQFEVPVQFDGTLVSEDIAALINNGKIQSTYLSAVFRQMQNEDFYTAVPRFIRTFGEDALMYTASKTRTETKGLGVSEVFGQWEKNNSRFAQNHPDVYGYFAPTATDFDYETYRRQLESGQRVRVSNARELIADTEAVIGKALYRDFRRQQGSSTSEYTRAVAAEYKQHLFELYPGYQTADLNISGRQSTLVQLAKAAEDPLIANTEIGRAAQIYFTERERVIGLAQSRRSQEGLPEATLNPLARASDADLRLQLRLLGERLASQYPAFDRMWSRELFNEVQI